MKVSSCSLQTALEHDLDVITRSQQLNSAQIYAVEILKSKFLSKRVESNATADQRAVDEFLAQDNRPEFESPIAHLLDKELKTVLCDMFDSRYYSPSFIFQLADVGPGATVGKTTDNSFFGKFVGDVTYSNPDLLRLFKAACECDPRWFCVYNDILSGGRFIRKEGGQMSAVPKTVDMSRLVVSPLSLDVFVDKAVGRAMEMTLQDLGINLTTQPDINRDMARIGSITGRFATIDLKGASNHIRYSRFMPLLPEYIQSWIRLTRPKFVYLPDGSLHELKMIQTMGSGITFPLQTILFLAIAKLAYRMSGIQAVTRNVHNVSVFGDDIIVHRRCFNTMLSLLKHFGFVVNEEKTFNSGPFRESCGADWYVGVNVRPVFVKQLRSREDIYGTINRMNEWCLRLGLLALTDTISVLLGNNRRPLLVPQHSHENAGIRIPFCYVNSQHYRAHVPLLSTMTLSKGVVDSNPTLFLLACLRGEVEYERRRKRYVVHIRPHTPKYVVRRQYTPNWDANPFHIRNEYGRLVSTDGAGFGRVWDVNPKAVTWTSLWLGLCLEDRAMTT